LKEAANLCIGSTVGVRARTVKTAIRI
jgi:hypothetical protein